VIISEKISFKAMVQNRQEGERKFSIYKVVGDTFTLKISFKTV